MEGASKSNQATCTRSVKQEANAMDVQCSYSQLYSLRLFKEIFHRTNFQLPESLAPSYGTLLIQVPVHKMLHSLVYSTKFMNKDMLGSGLQFTLGRFQKYPLLFA